MKIWKAILVCAVLVSVSSLMAGPKQTVLHAFTYNDGAYPNAAPVADASGNLYGTTLFAGPGNGGTVYELSPSGASWAFMDLWNFNTSDPNGSFPEAPVILDSNGNLYGTLNSGGDYFFGAVFELVHSGGNWTEQVLYSFNSVPNDATNPVSGLVFDRLGNLYGVTPTGGLYGPGAIYELSPSNGNWTESVIYSFCSEGIPCPDGMKPQSSLAIDAQGNLYGTTQTGGPHNLGVVFELSPSGPAWNFSIIHSFNYAQGANPVAGLIFDKSGNLYGTASQGGAAGQGVVFELTPSNGSWSEKVLYNFCSVRYCADGADPIAPLSLDPAGNLYGTTNNGGQNEGGTVFQLYRSGNSLAERAYQFPANGANGFGPYNAGVALVNDSLFGTTSGGGSDSGLCGVEGCGVVYQIAK